MLHIFLYTTVLFSCGYDDPFEFSGGNENSDQSKDTEENQDTILPFLISTITQPADG